MSKFTQTHVFTSEAVSEGHPDKVCDQISDAILDACLAEDPESHVACETAAGHNLVVNLGEITCAGYDRVNFEQIARDVVKDIGYDDPSEGFSYDTFKYISAIHGQSPDINQGVSRGADDIQGAGDQGMMFGYASNATAEFMPTSAVLSHKLISRLTELRHAGEIPYLRPDAKSQVSVLHEGGKPTAIKTVVISHQTRGVDLERIRKDLIDIAKDTLDYTGLINAGTKFLINPTGKFEIGGPCGDSGLTGRKIIVDTYGGVAAHGGGAFSGKDPSKVDRSAAYYARYAAKNIVAAGFADRCEIQVSYAIGVARPTSINVSFYGTGSVSEERMAAFLESGDVFDFRPGMLIKELGLKTPMGWSYRESTNGCHFGRAQFPWEKLDKVEAIKAVF